MQWRFNLRYIVLVLFNFYVTSYATTYYVSTNGDDNNSGISEDKTFRTLQKAADLVNAGDIVLVMQGTYPGVNIINKHGQPNAWIVFKSYPGHKVILDPYVNNYATTETAVGIVGCTYIEINGFEITDSNPIYSSNDFADYSQGVSRNGIKLNSPTSTYDAPSFIRIVNNHIHHIGSVGLHSTFGHHHEYLNNYIHHVGLSKRGYGMYIGGEDKIVQGNIVHDAYGHGILLYSGSGTVSRFLVENNTLYNNGRLDYGKGYEGGDYNERRGDGIKIYGNEDITVRNNIAYNNIEWGIRVSADRTLVLNNTLYNNAHQGLYVYDWTKDVTVQNNISYKNRGEEGYPGDYYVGPTTTQDHNLFSIDPKFVDAEKGDFRLQVGSPAIDAGVPVPGFNADFEGTPRPQGAGWDIGAHEFGGIPNTDKTPPSPPQNVKVSIQ